MRKAVLIILILFVNSVYSQGVRSKYIVSGVISEVTVTNMHNDSTEVFEIPNNTERFPSVVVTGDTLGDYVNSVSLGQGEYSIGHISVDKFIDNDRNKYFSPGDDIELTIKLRNGNVTTGILNWADKKTVKDSGGRNYVSVTFYSLGIVVRYYIH